MKILMVSIPSLHFFRWTEQLKDSGHEVYWFDITGMGGYVERLDWVQQHSDWKMKWDYKGRSFVKRNLPVVHSLIQKINERNTTEVFEEYLLKIKPDVVHSFALYLSCSPIFEVMNRYRHIKWVYSSWGSDLFYFQNKSKYLKDIQLVLPRIDYLFTDCKRDYEIASKYGFRGRFLGVFPGGGGFELDKLVLLKKPFEERKIVLIKGFQGRSGRAIPVLKAVLKLKGLFRGLEVVVFGADPETFFFVKKAQLERLVNFRVLGKITQKEVLELMGKSLLYVGNSNSDGIPNTLLEAICMGGVPIQSNPGGVTAEIIVDKVNGLLIKDCEDEYEIAKKIAFALQKMDLKKVQKINDEQVVPELDFSLIKDRVVKLYDFKMI